MEPTTDATDAKSVGKIDTELLQLNINDEFRTNTSLMMLIAALFHYGNQAMNPTQLAIVIKSLDLLPLPETVPYLAIQDIITTARLTAQDKLIPDPFRVEDDTGLQLKYAIADEILIGVQVPDPIEIPSTFYEDRREKRYRKQTAFYKPQSEPRKNNKKRSKQEQPEQQKPPEKRIIAKFDFDSSDLSDFEEDLEEFGFSEDSEDYSAFQTVELPKKKPVVTEEEDDTIATYSLLYYPPTKDIDYIDRINFTDYPTASHFAIIQQKGYSYPRFRTLERTKIPKLHCEDKFRVTDIVKGTTVTGRLFILADGHGGSGCSEYFVRRTPAAVNNICSNYDSQEFSDPNVQNKLHMDIKAMIQGLDDDYLALKRQQIHCKSANERVENDGCTLILNIFMGEWLINVNVGDSRSVLISAPEPSVDSPPKADTIDSNYKMDVVFASQDHKPYLKHLARHILENGGEFVDSSQNRVIKVELDKLGTKNNKRSALKKARIRPKKSCEHPPTLNVARSCGDLDFKMESKIISCEPDITFIQISNQPHTDHCVFQSDSHKQQHRRHFLFMSTDGTFDYMFEEAAEQQNKAIARVIGPMIENGEKIGKYLFEEEEAKNLPTVETTDTDEGIKVASVRISPPEGVVESTSRIPLLHRELSAEESKARKIKERTLVASAKYFANREAAHGFFAPTLQNYDDCTIILIEI